MNLTQVSSLASFFNKVLFLPLLASFIVLDIDSYISVVVAFILCQLVAFAYLLVCARDVIRARCGSLSKAARTCAADVRAGAKVMVAYYADSLVVGFTRMLTDWHLGLAVFGKLSFSFSLINFALNFIGQFAMVAFPVLKRLGEEGKREKYLEIRSVLHCFLPAVYLGYAPVLLILGWWLPEYRESLAYLGLVLPVCVYSCKANILFSTYLKMSRDEGLLCAVNVATMVANAALSATAILGTGSVGAASVSIVASLAAGLRFRENYGWPLRGAIRAGLRPGGGYFGCVHGGVVVLGRLERAACGGCTCRVLVGREGPGGAVGARPCCQAAKGERL